MAKRKSQPAAPRAAAPPMSVRPSPRPSRLWLIPLGVLLVAGVGALLWWLAQGDARRATQANARVGGVEDCRVLPQFPKTVGFPGGVLLSTSERQIKGLVMFEQHPSGQDSAGNAQRKQYQHPSWTQAGWLGAPVLDEKGNVYVAPAPFISLLDNPPDKQNIIYRVDTATGVMQPFVTLPAAAPPSVENPYGVLGLTYDCETRTLYAASVSGSTRTQEQGRLFQISAATGAVIATRAGVDGFGLAVFDGTAGKRLYYGLARSPEVRSLALDAQGSFVGEARAEFSLAGVGPRGDDHARRISIESTTGDMLVRGMPFEFNLVAPSERQQTAYRYRYDRTKDTWSLVGTEAAQ